MPTKPENLKNLEHMGMDELKEPFLDVASHFNRLINTNIIIACDINQYHFEIRNRFIIDSTPCMVIEGKEVTAAVFAALAENYVSAVADGM